VVATTSGNKPPGTLEVPKGNKQKKKLTLTKLYKGGEKRK